MVEHGAYSSSVRILDVDIVFLNETANEGDGSLKIRLIKHKSVEHRTSANVVEIVSWI